MIYHLCRTYVFMRINDNFEQGVQGFKSLPSASIFLKPSSMTTFNIEVENSFLGD